MKRRLKLLSTMISFGLIFIGALSAHADGVQTGDGNMLHVKGHVFDPQGRPAADAKVTHFPFNLPAGSSVDVQNIPVSADGSFDASVKYEPIIGGRPFDWIAETQTSICLYTQYVAVQPAGAPLALDLHLVPKVNQSVKLTIDGQPAAHVKLQPAYFAYGERRHQAFASCPKQFSMGWSVETDDKGIATFTGVPSGYKAYFDVLDDRYEILGFLDYYEIGAKARINIALTHAGAIVGRLTYPDGKPVIGARCRAVMKSGYSSFAMSDGTGHYRMKRMAPGKYSMVVASVGSDWAAPWSSEATVISGQTTNHDFAITHGALVVGKVFDTVTGRPIAGISVGPEGIDLDRNRVQTGSDGSYQLRVCPGRQNLNVYGPLIHTVKTVDAVEGGTLNVDFRVEASHPD